jgi:hypothetical protein
MRFLPFAFVLASCASGQAPSNPDAFIARMREAAIGYSDRLQDFLCTQTMNRGTDNGSSGKHWRLLETREQELGYIAHKEHYKLLKVNGKTTNLEKRIKKGYFIPSGEFGTSLMWIFDPKAAAEFAWDHQEPDAGIGACVFRYRVQATTSTLVMASDADRVKMAHHGFVFADCSSGAIARIQIETEPASVVRNGRDMAIGVQSDIRYHPTIIAGQEFLLPQVAVETARFGDTLTKVEIDFQQYRKYESSSNIIFDDVPVKPEDPASP